MVAIHSPTVACPPPAYLPILSHRQPDTGPRTSDTFRVIKSKESPSRNLVVLHTTHRELQRHWRCMPRRLFPSECDLDHSTRQSCLRKRFSTVGQRLLPR